MQLKLARQAVGKPRLSQALYSQPDMDAAIAWRCSPEGKSGYGFALVGCNGGNGYLADLRHLVLVQGQRDAVVLGIAPVPADARLAAICQHRTQCGGQAVVFTPVAGLNGFKRHPCVQLVRIWQRCWRLLDKTVRGDDCLRAGQQVFKPGDDVGLQACKCLGRLVKVR